MSREPVFMRRVYQITNEVYDRHIDRVEPLDTMLDEEEALRCARLDMADQEYDPYLSQKPGVSPKAGVIGWTAALSVAAFIVACIVGWWPVLIAALSSIVIAGVSVFMYEAWERRRR
jgi:4-hydroxybenzoate polyprenyltransferase